MNTKHSAPENSSFGSNTNMPSYIVMALSGLSGGLSLFYFGRFLYTGLPAQINFGLSESMSIFINILLSMLFFLQHSLMLRKGFRKKLSVIVSQDYHGALFSICSGASLFILILFWQKTTSIQIDIQGIPYYFIRFLFFFSIIGLFFTMRSLKYFDPFGIRNISAHIKRKTIKDSVFTVRGTYKSVRHPLYFFSLLMIWATISITTDRILFNFIWTVWIIIGTILEERDLIDTFGNNYRNYQKEVPMLIPYKWRLWR